MTTKTEIKRIMTKFRNYWLENRNLRLTQIVNNMKTNKDIFYVTNKEFEDYLDRLSNMIIFDLNTELKKLGYKKVKSNMKFQMPQYYYDGLTENNNWEVYVLAMVNEIEKESLEKIKPTDIIKKLNKRMEEEVK